MLAWDAETISLMKFGQLWGHSCLRIDTSTRFSLFSKVFCDRRLSSEFAISIMILTMKFRIPLRACQQECWLQLRVFNLPVHCSLGKIFHRVMITLSNTCSPRSILLLAKLSTKSSKKMRATFCLRIFRLLEYSIDQRPRVGILFELHNMLELVPYLTIGYEPGSWHVELVFAKIPSVSFEPEVFMTLISYRLTTTLVEIANRRIELFY
jgi:hypothetical protein